MRKITLLMLWLVGVIAVSAGKVTELEALKIAQQYMVGKSAQQKQLHRVQMQGVEQFHVFNAEAQGGFVIVSGDDRTMPVLGYSDHGSLDYNNLPIHVKAWLDGYVEQIKSLGDDNKPEPHRAIGYSINPLVTCHWDQGDPYNSQCPMDGSSRSVTGCVATAMAQLMYYHKWPKEEVPALGSYYTLAGKNVPALPATTFQWDKMKDNYVAGETGASVNAMAELMRYCGQAVHMNYSSNESGANVYASDFINIFGYSKTAKSVTRADYTTSEWEAMIYNELANERPVLYAGASDTGGHQFIIDGYDNNGLFHVNWGWGGYADGYFVLSILNPDGHGIGGGTSSNGYAIGQDAIIGVQPDNGEEEVMPDLFEYDPAFDSGSYTRSSVSKDFSSVDVEGTVFCRDNSMDYHYAHAWAICQNGQIIHRMEESADREIPAGYGIRFKSSLSFGKDLEDGTYELRHLYRLTGTNEWMICGYSGSIILAEINGTELTLKFSSEVEDAIKVNSVTMQGDKKEGRPITLVMNWTNNGYLNENTFYVYLGSVTGGYVASSSSYVAPGETGDFEISFALRAAGRETLIIKDSWGNIIYTDIFDVAETSQQRLVANSVIIDGVDYYGTAKGTILDAKVTFKNDGNNDYDDNVIISMQPLEPAGGTSYYFVGNATDVIEHLSLQKGKTLQMQAHFTDLTPNQLYGLIFYYYSKNGLTMSDYIYYICTTGDATTEISVGEDGYATYCPEYGVDFSNATEIAAYKASVSDNYVTLTKVDKVAAGEGVLLRSLNGGAVKEELPVIEDATVNEDNAFVGVLEAITLRETDGNITNFVLSKKNGEIGFYKANNTPIAAGKAYLPVVNYSATGMSLGMTFGDTTGIREVEIKQSTADDATYTLGGVRVKNPTKGIYIKNGKKVVVK